MYVGNVRYVRKKYIGLFIVEFPTALLTQDPFLILRTFNGHTGRDSGEWCCGEAGCEDSFKESAEEAQGKAEKGRGRHGA